MMLQCQGNRSVNESNIGLKEFLTEYTKVRSSRGKKCKNTSIYMLFSKKKYMFLKGR